MTYYTSWDVNVFLCLVTIGIPEDVAKRAVMVAKKTHEEFSIKEAMNHWVSNYPKLVKTDSKISAPPLYRSKYCLNFTIRIPGQETTWRNYREVIIGFKKEWIIRSIEDRQKKVIEWCEFGTKREKLLHQGRLRKCCDESYTKNLWSTWEAGASSYYFVGHIRRVNISKWYEGIHPGRFFLFYRKNKIIEERHRGIPKGPCEYGYQYPKTPIFDWGPYEQLIEDLRCIDGPGLGESPGSKIEHIDDLFSK